MLSLANGYDETRFLVWSGGVQHLYPIVVASVGKVTLEM